MEAHPLKGFGFTNGSGSGYSQFVIQAIIPQQGGGISGQIMSLRYAQLCPRSMVMRTETHGLINGVHQRTLQWNDWLLGSVPPLSSAVTLPTALTSTLVHTAATRRPGVSRTEGQ